MMMATYSPNRVAMTGNVHPWPLVPAFSSAAKMVDDTPNDAFAKLTRLVASNDRESAELQRLNERLAQARAYAADPCANPILAQAYLERVRNRRARVLAVLRANRLEAREFLAC